MLSSGDPRQNCTPNAKKTAGIVLLHGYRYIMTQHITAFSKHVY